MTEQQNISGQLTQSTPEEFEITGNVLTSYKGNAQEVTVPDGITVIADGAFYGCTVQIIHLSESVIQIGRSAFSECMKLQSINFPQRLEVVADAAFEHCPALVEVFLPDSVQYLGRMAFSKCISLRTVKMPAGLHVIAHGMFMGDAELTNLTLPYFVTGIEDFAFYMCRSLEEMYLPDLTVDIGPHTLYGCKGLKRGHIKGINLTRFGPDECMIFALLYLSTREKYSYWEMVMYESFIHEYRDRVFRRILDAGSQDALHAIVHMDMVDAVCLEKWSEAARASGNLEFTAKLLQYRQELFSEPEDMWEI